MARALWSQLMQAHRWRNLPKTADFRKVFNADPNVGGRFSALTDFGLVPAALLGMDIGKIAGFR